VTKMELNTFSRRKFRISFLRILSLKLVSIYFGDLLRSKLSKLLSSDFFLKNLLHYFRNGLSF